jgi:DNA polymerase-3 subunit epsilon
MSKRGTVYERKSYDLMLKLPREKVLCIDTETTGLNPETDEILQLSMVDGNGTVIFSSLLRPPTRKRWPKAQAVNGISWQMVKDQPSLASFEPIIRSVIDSSDLVIGYNIDFDLRMLKAAGIGVGIRMIYDVMEDYAQAFGRWSAKKDDYLWVKLSEAAGRYGVSFEAHDARADAQATVELFYSMLADETFRSMEPEFGTPVDMVLRSRDASIRTCAEQLKGMGTREATSNVPTTGKTKESGNGFSPLLKTTLVVISALIINFIAATQMNFSTVRFVVISIVIASIGAVIIGMKK